MGEGIVSAALASLEAEVHEHTTIARLHAVVFEENKRSANVLIKAGFVREGCLSKAIYKNGYFYNALGPVDLSGLKFVQFRGDLIAARDL